MRKTISRVTAAAIAVLALTSPAAADIPRTASGKPDLSGTYDSATLTPLTRPKEYGDNLYLTPEEAQRLSQEEQQRIPTHPESLEPAQ